MQTEQEKWGQAPFFRALRYGFLQTMEPGPIYSPRSAFLTVFHHTAIAKQGIRQSRAASMSERSELRSRREERMENGVKNLKGARLFPKTFLNSGTGNA
jgi:hypothetical protein